MLGDNLRSDSWENLLTGFGTLRDKTMAGSFNPSVRLDDATLSALYHHEDIAGRVVSIIPREMLRHGFGVTCPDARAAQVVSGRLRALRAVQIVRDAATWGRLYGGAVVLIGADDGQDAREPLDESRIRSLSFLQVYDRRRAWPDQWYENSYDPRYGSPRLFRLTNYRTGMMSLVHESRLLLFRGAHTGDQERWMNQDWDFSILQRPYEAIRQFSAIYKAAELMMTDASQGVFKMNGLLNYIANGQLKDLQTRALFMDQCRSVARAIMLDSSGGESFEKIQTAFSGVGEMLDRAANRLAAGIDMPVTRLMGQAPAGLNATGDSDLRSWYDQVEADREQDLRPNLERLVRLVALAERMGDRAFQVCFKPLWQETAKEKAEREKIEADTAAVWIQNEVLDPEDVARARFTGSEPQPYKIDPRKLATNPNLDPVVKGQETVTPLSGEVTDTPPTDQNVKVAPEFVLNGAQITAAVGIVSQVVMGELPRDAGIGQLIVLFNLTNPQAEQIMGSAGRGFKATPQ